MMTPKEYKIEEATARDDLARSRVDRIFTYTFKSLDRLQSMCETELLELDALVEELDKAIGPRGSKS